MKRLASLSALGAGVLTASGEASTIVYSGILDETVGFGQGAQRSLTFETPGGAGGSLARFRQQIGTNAFSQTVFLGGKKGADGTEFRFLGTKGPNATHPYNFARAVPIGIQWTNALAMGSRGMPAGKGLCAAQPGGKRDAKGKIT